MSRSDVVYPPKGMIKIDGGLNTKYDKQLLPDNETPDAQNCVYVGDAIETRGGTSKLNTTAVGSHVCDGLYTRHDRSGAETMCAFYGGLMYTLAGTTFTTVPSAQSVFTAGVQVAAAEYENYIFFGNGTTPYKYNGSFTRHGIPAPVSAPSVVCAGTGALNGDYSWKIVNVNSGLVESDVGLVTTTLTISNGQVSLTDIPVAAASHGVNQRRVYRTEAGGSTYKRVTTIADNTTTSYTDNIADASLGAAAPTDQGEPPNYSVILYHKNRLFMNDTGNLNQWWYSELGNPYVVKADNSQDVGDNSGDLLRALALYGDFLYAFCDNSTWVTYMADTDPANWETVRVISPYGTRSPFGWASYNNKIMIPALQNNLLVGFATIQGNTVKPDTSLLTVSATQSDLTSNRIEPDVFEIQEGYLDRIKSIVYKNKIYIAVTAEASNTQNNKIWIYDFSKGRLNKSQEGSWMPWTGLKPGFFTIYAEKLYYGSSDAVGRVYEMNTQTYNDDGAAIDSYIWSKEFFGRNQDETFHKDFRFVNVLVQRSGAYNMELRTRTDSDSGSGNQLLVDLDPGGSVWGTFVWGRDDWSAGSSDKEQEIFLGNTRGKRIQVRFSNMNTINQKFRLLGFSFGYNRKGKR